MTYAEVEGLRAEKKPFYRVIQCADDTLYIEESRDYPIILDYGYWDACQVEPTPEKALESYIEDTKKFIKKYQGFLSQACNMLDEFKREDEGEIDLCDIICPTPNLVIRKSEDSEKLYVVLLTKEEKELIYDHLTFTNLCSAGCEIEAKTGEFPDFDCDDVDDQGNTKCPLIRTRRSVLNKIR